jgi:hypothetical protein
MQAYVDDSTEPPVFVLAGFVARAEQWAEFTVRWRDALAKPPRLQYFKMKEANACQGQFTGWSVADRDARLADLVGIIKDHALVGISSIVRHTDYSEILRKRIAKPLDSPYWLMYYSIVRLVFEWELASGKAEKVDFIFDEQLHQSEQVQEKFDIFYELSPPHIKELFGERPAHRDDKMILPLQAADMLAWHIHRVHSEKEAGIDFDSPTMRVLRTIPPINDIWTKERLQALLTNYKKQNKQFDRISLYEDQRMKEDHPDFMSLYNLQIIAKARPNSSIILGPFLARGTQRFLLVHSCPRSNSPHLHRRSGDKCSLESPISDSASRL